MRPLPPLSLMERVLFLRRVPLFADLQPAELKQVASIAQERLFSDGETICRQGEAGGEVDIVIFGEGRGGVGGGGGGPRGLARANRSGSARRPSATRWFHPAGVVG